jgi:hypothetical protein
MSRACFFPAQKEGVRPTHRPPAAYRIAGFVRTGDYLFGCLFRFVSAISWYQEELVSVRLPGSIAGILVAVVLIAAVVWLGRYAPWVEKPPDPLEARVVLSEPVRVRKEKEAKRKAEHKDEKPSTEIVQAGRPPLADKPPFPKAVVGDKRYDLGTVEPGESKAHVFRIENKGEGRLILTSGWSTDAAQQWRKEVPPGGSADVEVSLEPDGSTPTDSLTKTIWTNDPKLPEIDFRVQAKVIKHVRIEPKHEWKVRITGDQDGKFTGKIVADLEGGFKILSIESNNRNVKAVPRALEAAELQKEGMRNGYAIDLTVNRDIPLGVFESQLTIHTTLKKFETIDIKVTALQLR